MKLKSQNKGSEELVIRLLTDKEISSVAGGQDGPPSEEDGGPVDGPTTGPVIVIDDPA